MKRTDLSMTDEEAEAFIAEHLFARLATADLTGQPHITPVGYVDWEGRIYLRVLRRSRRAKQLAENPKVSFCIDDGVGVGEGYEKRRGLVISGVCTPTTEVVPDHPVEHLFLTRHEADRGYLWSKSHEWMVIDPERRVSWDFSKIPAGADRNLDRRPNQDGGASSHRGRDG